MALTIQTQFGQRQILVDAGNTNLNAGAFNIVMEFPADGFLRRILGVWVDIDSINTLAADLEQFGPMVSIERGGVLVTLMGLGLWNLHQTNHIRAVIIPLVPVYALPTDELMVSFTDTDIGSNTGDLIVLVECLLVREL